MDKITEKEIRQPDAFIQTIDRVNEKLQPNKKIIMAAVAALVLAGIAWATWDLYGSRREAQAQEALFIATHQVDKKEQELTPANKPDPKDAKNSKNVKPKVDAADKATLDAKPKNFDTDYGVPAKSLQSVIESYPGTRASWLAALDLARLHQQYGDVDQSLQALQQPKLEVGNKAGDLISATIQLRMGDLLQIKGQCDQAVTKWNLITAANGFVPLQPEALLRTGLCYETLKNFDGARNTYEKLSKDAPDSRAGREGKKFLKLLQSTRKAS
jgi:predicted negative regulator of RcsB-dependent stress response